MRLQKLYTLIIFIVLTNALSVYGMKRKVDEQLAQETEQYNNTHLLVYMPVELQQQISFPFGSIAEITEDNVNELNEHIKAFFAFKRVCKKFNDQLKFSWESLKLEIKNKMMQEVLALMEKFSYECCSQEDCSSLCAYKYPEKVSSGYKKYRIIPLALVYAGADVDITSEGVPLIKEILGNLYSTTCLSKALHAQDTLAIAMLLNHKANPYQKSHDEHCLLSSKLKKIDINNYQNHHVSNWYGPICFRPATVEIITLFLEKTDKIKLLAFSKNENVISELMNDYYAPEVMKFWLDYGINVYSVPNRSAMCELAVGLRIDSRITVDNFFKKAEFLLKSYPDTVNIKDERLQRTPLDFIEDWSNRSVENKAKGESIVTMLRNYGAKTSKELEEENLK